MLDSPEAKAGLDALQRAYNTEIRSLAEELIKGIASGEITDGYEWLHETIDGHNWVIYTYKARLVGVLTDSPDAYEDDFGEAPKSPEVAAYASMQRDVIDHAGRYVDNLDLGNPDPDDWKDAATEITKDNA